MIQTKAKDNQKSSEIPVETRQSAQYRNSIPMYRLFILETMVFKPELKKAPSYSRSLNDEGREIKSNKAKTVLCQVVVA